MGQQALRLLLDSHALLWWLDETELAAEARDAIAEPDNAVWVSAASVWELAIKASTGKLHLPGDLRQQIEDEGFLELPISAAHGLRAGALPRIHADPFDRMLIAQALIGGLTIVTRDRRFPRYGVAVFPA